MYSFTECIMLILSELCFYKMLFNTCHMRHQQSVLLSIILGVGKSSFSMNLQIKRKVF